MSKETLAKATNSSNMEMEPNVTHDADRVAAMAGGNVLGGLLLRFREGEQPQWAKRIVLILARRMVLRQHLTRSIAERTACAALEEFRSPYCTSCRGARETMIGRLKLTCPACEGSGRQHHTDASRRARIGTYGRRIAEAMDEAHKDMSSALGAYLGHAAGRLE